MSRIVQSGAELGAIERELRYLDATRHPGIAQTHLVCAAVVEILGPSLWVALIVLWVVAELGS
ncbi:MAG TPA: hypothetical protein VFA12_10470 [Stellaceae bacterium]|nr:hypothetical protein [Stellaceae bacterium]